jgi:hypothetical protein
MTTTHTITSDQVSDYTVAWSTVNVNFKADIPRCIGKFRLGFSPQGEPARQTHGGPLVVKLFGSFMPQAIVVAARPISDGMPTITVQVGDVIVIEEQGIFVVGAPTRMDWDRPTLVALASWEDDADNGWVVL